MAEPDFSRYPLFIAEDGFNPDPGGVDAWRDDHRLISESGLFEHGWYAARYPDVWYSGLPPLEHYVKYGARLGRRPRADFAVEAPAEPSASFADPFAAWIRSRPSAPRPPETPRVSVLTITYNQAGFIRQTLDGILAQETDFPFELIVGDDRSTDGTAEIIAEYAARDPRIVPVLRAENLGPNENFADLTRRIRGRYVAMCEGDDYWTDPTKLQQQFDLLEARPEVSVCFHTVRIVYEGLSGIEDTYPHECPPEPPVEDLVRHNLIQTNSVMYRWRYGGAEAFDLTSNVAPGDWYLHLMHAEIGRVAYIPKVMAVYRKHAGGMWATYQTELDRHKKLGDAEMEFFRRLRTHFGGRFEAHYRVEQKAIFRRLAEAYLHEEDAPALLRLIRTNSDVAGAVLAEMGFEPGTVEAADAEALRATLEAQASVSVVVTAYNHAATIERCLRSVLAQRGFLRLQVVVGDDRSSDGSAALIEAVRAGDPDRVTVLPRPANLGMLANLRDCFAACTGRFIAICEGDDYWLSDRKLAKQLALLRNHPDAGFCFNWVLLHYIETGTYLPHEDQGRFATGPVGFVALAKTPLTANFSCCLYRAEAVRAVPDAYYANPLSADWLFNLYVADRGGVVFLKDLLSVYTIQEKGQWSGLPEDLKDARVGLLQKDFSAIFGEGRGFEEFEVGCTVMPAEGGLPEHLRAYLETPQDRTWAEVEDAQILLEGWVLAGGPGEVTLIAEIDGKTTRHPVRMHRPDVISAVHGAVPTTIDEARCGFRFSVLYAPLLHVTLKVEFEHEAHPWLSLMFTHRVIPKKRA